MSDYPYAVAFSIILSVLLLLKGTFLANFAEVSISPAEKSLSRRSLSLGHPIPMIFKTSALVISMLPFDGDTIYVIVIILVFTKLSLNFFDIVVRKPFTK
jgi:hypothetical protein